MSNLDEIPGDDPGYREHTPEHGGQLRVIATPARARELARRKHAKDAERLDAAIEDAAESAAKTKQVRAVLRELGFREAEEVVNKLKDGDVGKLARTVAVTKLSEALTMEAKTAKEAIDVAKGALMMARLEEGKHDGAELAGAVTDTLRDVVTQLRKRAS